MSCYCANACPLSTGKCWQTRHEPSITQSSFIPVKEPLWEAHYEISKRFTLRSLKSKKGALKAQDQSNEYLKRISRHAVCPSGLASRCYFAWRTQKTNARHHENDRVTFRSCTWLLAWCSKAWQHVPSQTGLATCIALPRNTACATLLLCSLRPAGYPIPGREPTPVS